MGSLHAEEVYPPDLDAGVVVVEAKIMLTYNLKENRWWEILDEVSLPPASDGFEYG